MSEKRILDIFVVTYNRANYLEKSINSILMQSYKDFNLIILDNCSNDNTRETVEKFSDSRISYICHRENIGGIGNINYAINHANSKYFMIFHDDDIMHETLIQDELTILEENPDISIISCKSDSIDENDNKTSECRWENKLHRYSGSDFFNAYVSKHTFILFPSIIYRTEFMKSNSIYLDINVGPSSDVYMCFEIERNGGVIAVLDRILMSYRRHRNQDSSQNRVEMIVKLFDVLQNDSYYSNILAQNEKGQKKYYRWLMHNEICMVQSKLTNCEEAMQAQRKYERVMEYSKWDHVKYKCIIFDEKYFVISKVAYRILKKMKGKI